MNIENPAGFFKHLDTLLRRDYGVTDTRLLVKTNCSAPADEHIMHEVRGFDAAVTGLGD